MSYYSGEKSQEVERRDAVKMKVTEELLTCTAAALVITDTLSDHSLPAEGAVFYIGRRAVPSPTRPWHRIAHRSSCCVISVNFTHLSHLEADRMHQ